VSSTMDQVEEKKRRPVAQGEDSPECYGDPKLVCPKDERGIIMPQTECLSCCLVTKCLRHALRREGVIRSPLEESPVVSKVSGFLKRWSDRKLAGASSPDKGAS